MQTIAVAAAQRMAVPPPCQQHSGPQPRASLRFAPFRSSGRQQAAVLPPRQLLQQQQASSGSNSWQRRRAVAVRAAAPRDFDKERFEALNKDYSLLTQKIEVGLP